MFPNSGVIFLFAAAISAQSIPESVTPESVTEVRRLLAQHDLAGAEVIVDNLVAKSPDSPQVRTVAGELDFRKGKIGDAEKNFKKAITLDENTPRAWIGLARVLECAAMRHTAELYVVKASQIAPQDRAVQNAMAAFQWEHEHADERRLTSPYAHAEIPFVLLMHDGRTIRKFALAVSINGGKPLSLMLDTGASGILLRTKAAERAGLEKIRDTKIGGIGDQGRRDAWTSKADIVQIGGVSFADFPLEATEKQTLGDDDGLIGTDVFKDFLVTLDFFNRKLKLDPLPGGQPDRKRTYDRVRDAPDLAGFSQIFQMGHSLLIKTMINDKGPEMFLIDTGSATNLVAKKYAQESTKVHSDADTKLKGISGKVANVGRADELTLQFATFKQVNRDMIAFDMDEISRGVRMELGGVLGLPLLNMFRTITIDYRDGVIKFEYKDH